MVVINRCFPFESKKRWIFLFVFIFSFFSHNSAGAQQEEDYKILREIILNEFKDDAPEQHGGFFQEALTRFETKDKKTAIALVACLDTGPQVDVPLLNRLSARRTPFSVFADSAWLNQNKDELEPFVGNGFAQFENHGTFCRALSVDGKIPGDYPKTISLEDVFEEIEDNARLIEKLSGRLPRFYRGAYDYYDDVALKVVNVLGYQAVQGDLKLRPQDVLDSSTLKTFMNQLRPGSIILIPANRPKNSDKWVGMFLDGIAGQGYSVVSLGDVAGVNLDDY